MQARAHLKLIVSEPDVEPRLAEQQPREPDSEHERTSMVQPMSSARLHLRWLGANALVVALWAASALLLGIAGALLVTRL